MIMESFFGFENSVVLLNDGNFLFLSQYVVLLFNPNTRFSGQNKTEKNLHFQQTFFAKIVDILQRL